LASSCQSFVQTTGNAVATAINAPLVWGSTITLALGQAAMLGVGLVAFLVYLRIAPRGEQPARSEDDRIAA
jgi:DHA1 family bicyclomycin/chloramphenicol resistance-like MFS transporter